MAIQRMYPIQHFCSFAPYGTGWGTHTAAGSSTDSGGSGDCYSYCDDLEGALDETAYGNARSSSTAGQVNHGRAEFTFDDPPQNVTIVSLTLVVWVRTSNAGAAIIDSTPTIQLFNYVSGGSRVYQTGTQSVTAARNRNTEGPTGSFQKLTYTWATKPAGGAWTRAELLSGQFKAGLESDGGAGHGSGVDATTGGSSASLDWASVYLELETTPSGAYIEPIRTAQSHQLRLFSRPTRIFKIDVPAEFGSLEPGGRMWSSHGLLPWAPGVRSWENIPLYLLEVEEHLKPRHQTLTFLDLREVGCEFWSPFQITGIDTQNTGLALIHKGGTWATSRNQVAYAQRPGDGLYQQVAVNSPMFDRYGLLIQGGSDKNWLLNSTFSQGTSDTFTSWSKTLVGTGTVTQDTSDYLIDTGGFQRSAKCTAPAVGDTARVYQTTATIGHDTKVRVRVWYKHDSGTDEMKVAIQRGAGDYWNDGSSTWVAGPVYNSIGVATSITRVTSREIDVGGSDVTLTVTVGFEVVAAAAVGHVYSVEVQSFTDAGSTIGQWWRRDLLPTTTTAVTREKDQTVIRNFPTTRVWSTSRGFFRATIRLLFEHLDMADSTAFAILMGSHDLYYVRTDASNGYFVFGDGSGAAQFATSAGGTPNLPTTTPFTIAGRWTSAAEDELDISGQSFAIWVNGVKGATVATGLAEVSMAGDDEITIGNDPVTTLTTPLDGHITNFVIGGWCPTDDEMARM